MKVCLSTAKKSKVELVARSEDGYSPEEEKYYIYVTGGRLRGRTLGSVERYGLKSNMWEACPTLRENRGSHGAATIGNRIFVIGGGGFDSNLASCEALDVNTNEWQFVKPTVIYRHALALVSTNFIDPHTSIASPSIYALGGWIDGKICSGDVERYDAASDTWSTCASLLVPRRLFGATAFGDRIYAFGGNCDDGVWYTAAAERYDPHNNQWERLPDLPYPGPTSCATVGDFIYIFLHGKWVYRFDPATNDYTKCCPSLPLLNWYSFDVCVCGFYIFVVGGANDGVWSRALFRFDTRTNEWKRLPDMIQQRRRCAATIVHIDKESAAES